MRVFRAIALSPVIGLAACGATPAAQNVPETIVVVPPAPTASAAPAASTDTPDPIPSRPASAAGDVEACIAELRTLINPVDQSRAGGAGDYQDGLSAERAGDLQRARKAYFSVIQNNPASAFVPASYFAFGEMFATEAKSDPMKTAFAEQAFNEVLKYPPPASQLRAAATYRLGQVRAKDDVTRALAHFSKAAKADRDWAEDGCAAEIAAAALSASIPVFIEVADPSKCFTFYASLTGDGVRAALSTLELAQQYARAKRGTEAAKCLSRAVDPAVRSQPDDDARATYCKRAKDAADAARTTASAGDIGALDKALQSVCK